MLRPLPAGAESLQQNAAQLLDGVPTLQQAAAWGFAELWQAAKDFLSANIGEPLRFGLRAAGYLLVSGVLGLLAGAANWRRCIDAVAVLGFAAMSLAAGIDLVRAAGDTARDCQNYLIAFVPVYSGIAAAGGQTAGALVYSGMFFAMAQFLAAVIGNLLLPVLEIYFCFAACACVWGSHAVEEAAALFSKCLHWLLKACGAVFSLVLGLQGVLAGTADSAALRTGKSVLQGAVPVVGDAAAAIAQGLAGVGGAAGTGRILCAGSAALSFVQSCVFRCGYCRAGWRAKAVRAAVPVVRRGSRTVRFGPCFVLFPCVFIHSTFAAYRKWGVGMAALRSAAFGCCVLSTVAGLVRVFWPENGFKPVINAVLALYIITAGVQIVRGTSWADLAAQLAPSAGSAAASEAEVDAYRQTLTDQAAAQALRDVLSASGMDAAVSRTDAGWRVTLVHAADRARAEALLAANCGAIPYEISTGGAP